MQAGGRGSPVPSKCSCVRMTGAMLCSEGMRRAMFRDHGRVLADELPFAGGERAGRACRGNLAGLSFHRL